MGLTMTSQQAASCNRAAQMVVHAPLKAVLALCRRMRGAAVAAGQVLCVCAPAAGVLRLLGPSCRPVGAACPYATARQSARRSTGGRAATRRHAHGCVTSGRGGSLGGGEATSSCNVSPCQWVMSGYGPNSECAWLGPWCGAMVWAIGPWYGAKVWGRHGMGYGAILFAWARGRQSLWRHN